MKIKSQTSKKTTLPKVAIEFESDFEKNKFIDYVNELIFDGIYFRKALDKDKISGVYSDLIIEKDLICFIGAAQGEPFALWWEPIPENSIFCVVGWAIKKRPSQYDQYSRKRHIFIFLS